MAVPARRPPTAAEAKALAHPLRQRLVRLLSAEDLTNRQLADRLGADPATVLYHVRILAGAGLVEQLPVRHGTRGAREKPYRSTGRSWWLDDPLAGTAPDVRFGPVELAMEELRASAPGDRATFATFTLHLTPEDVTELDRRLLEVIDEYVATDAERRDRPVHRGFFAVHRVATGSPPGSPDRGRDGPEDAAADRAEDARDPGNRQE